MNRVALMLVALVATSAVASEDVLTRFKRYLPNTTVSAIRPAPIKGLYEIELGSTVAYVSEDGRYLLFGNIFDVETRTDITAGKQRELRPETEGEPKAIAFEALPAKDAVLAGTLGARNKVAVFVDADCGYCRQIPAMALPDVELQIYPLALLSSGARAEYVTGVLCATDRFATYKKAVAGQPIKGNAQCKAHASRIAKAAQAAGVRGTPSWVFADGTRVDGYLDAVEVVRRATKGTPQ
jgi:thiol:disulfide interchange protein DsbC